MKPTLAEFFSAPPARPEDFRRQSREAAFHASFVATAILRDLRGEQQLEPAQALRHMLLAAKALIAIAADEKRDRALLAEIECWLERGA